MVSYKKKILIDLINEYVDWATKLQGNWHIDNQVRANMSFVAKKIYLLLDSVD